METFTTAFRGYAPDEVEARLATDRQTIRYLTEALELCQAALAEAQRSDEDYRAATQELEDLLGDLGTRASQVHRDAEDHAQLVLGDAREEAERVMIQARADADHTVAAAGTEAETLREQARERDREAESLLRHAVDVAAGLRRTAEETVRNAQRALDDALMAASAEPGEYPSQATELLATVADADGDAAVVAEAAIDLRDDQPPSQPPPIFSQPVNPESQDGRRETVPTPDDIIDLRDIPDLADLFD